MKTIFNCNNRKQDQMQDKRNKGNRLEAQAFKYCQVMSFLTEYAVTWHVQYQATCPKPLQDWLLNEPAKVSRDKFAVSSSKFATNFTITF